MEPTTFVLIKPDAMKLGLADTILERFRQEGLTVLRSKKVRVEKETILTHYEEVLARLNKDYLSQAILDEFLDQDVLILVLSEKDQDPIKHVRTIIGATDPSKADPTSLRGQFIHDTLEQSIVEKRWLRNLIHASDSPEAVQKETALWFDR
jgi:nucleoside-diphosphate kinase